MKKLSIKFLQRAIFLLIFPIFGSNNALEDRSLYVDNFNNILSSNNNQAKLFEFTKEHKITVLILYDLNKIHQQFDMSNSERNQILANFIREAKTKHGIKKISASGESGDFFINAIHPYNLSRRDKIERFDIYNLEYEYWNESQSKPGGYYCETYLKNGQLKCDRENSFKYYIQTLEVMRLLADELDHDILVEAYIGNFNRNEVKQISAHVNRLLIHDYVSKEQRLFPYVKERLKLLEEINSNVNVSILYSTESRYLGKYLKTHSFYESENKFFKQLNLFQKDLDDHLNFTGFTYYNYSYFRYVENIKD